MFASRASAWGPRRQAWTRRRAGAVGWRYALAQSARRGAHCRWRTELRVVGGWVCWRRGWRNAAELAQRAHVKSGQRALRGIGCNGAASGCSDLRRAALARRWRLPSLPAAGARVLSATPGPAKSEGGVPSPWPWAFRRAARGALRCALRTSSHVRTQTPPRGRSCHAPRQVPESRRVRKRRPTLVFPVVPPSPPVR